MRTLAIVPATSSAEIQPAFPGKIIRVHRLMLASDGGSAVILRVRSAAVPLTPILRAGGSAVLTLDLADTPLVCGRGEALRAENLNLFDDVTLLVEWNLVE